MTTDVDSAEPLTSRELEYWSSLLKALENAPAEWIANRIEAFPGVRSFSDTARVREEQAEPTARITSEGRLRPIYTPEVSTTTCPECGGPKAFTADRCRECFNKAKVAGQKLHFFCKDCKLVEVIDKGHRCPACQEAWQQRQSKKCADCETRISPAATRCLMCAGKLRRKALLSPAPPVDRPFSEPVQGAEDEQEEAEAPEPVPDEVFHVEDHTEPDVTVSGLGGLSGVVYGKPFVGMRAPVSEDPKPKDYSRVMLTGARCPRCTQSLRVDSTDAPDEEFCFCGFRRTIVPKEIMETVQSETEHQRRRQPSHSGMTL